MGFVRPGVGEVVSKQVSAPDANSCQGCHNAPFGISGGAGDFVTSVFVQAQRFDYVSLGKPKPASPDSATEDVGDATLQTIGNIRATTSLFGSATSKCSPAR